MNSKAALKTVLVTTSPTPKCLRLYRWTLFFLPKSTHHKGASGVSLWGLPLPNNYRKNNINYPFKRNFLLCDLVTLRDTSR